MSEYAFRIRIGESDHVYVMATTAIKAMEATVPLLNGRSIEAVELLGPTVATMLAWSERAAKRRPKIVA